MNRRAFVASAVGLKLRAAESKSNLLLPSDTPYEHQLRLVWYNPVCEARAKRSPRLRIFRFSYTRFQKYRSRLMAEVQQRWGLSRFEDRDSSGPG